MRLRHGAKGLGTSQKLNGIIVPGMGLLWATGPASGQNRCVSAKFWLGFGGCLLMCNIFTTFIMYL